MSTIPYLIVGLGNPTARYADTRHNAGIHYVTTLVPDTERWRALPRCGAEIIMGTLCGHRTVFARSTRYMNESGQTVAALCKYYDIPLSRLIVAHDESDLYCGTFVIQYHRGHGGHNGVRDVTRVLGSSAYHRVRIGVRPQTPPDAPRPKASAFVLRPFSATERAQCQEQYPIITKTLCEHLQSHPT